MKKRLIKLLRTLIAFVGRFSNSSNNSDKSDNFILLAKADSLLISNLDLSVSVAHILHFILN